MSELTKYLELPYTIVLRRDSEGDVIARIEELRGCSAHGKTPQEALENLEEAKSLWIQDCLENGDPVPVPTPEESLPSGKWLQRVPRKLHRKLQTLARNEGASLNQYVTALLAEAVGERKAREERVPDGASVSKWVNHFFVGEPLHWQVVDVSCPMRTVTEHHVFIDTLAQLTSGIPNKSVISLKAKKDASKKHTFDC